MIFGHYSFPIRTLTPAEIPTQLKMSEPTQIQYTVRVAHIMFIPIFPFSKSWTLKMGDDKYNMSPEGVKLLDALFGQKNMPWYAFAGPILVAVFLLFGFVSDATKSTRQAFAAKRAASKSASIFEDNVQASLARITNPATNDYYEVTENGYNTFYKVTAFTQDSVTLQAPTENEAHRWYKRATKILFFDKSDVTFEQRAIAKKDLENALNKTQEATDFKGITLARPTDNLSIILQNIDRIDDNFINNELVQFKKEQAVKASFDQFLTGNNLDSAVLLLDKESSIFFTEMLSLAKQNDFSKIKDFINQAKYPLVTYKYMAYTKYVFLKSMHKSKEATSKEVAFKEYVFFLKLVEQGLWSFDLADNTKKILKKGRLSFSGTDHASIYVMGFSNILTKSIPIHFKVNLNKQDGLWKINVPSTFAYTENQIEKAATNESLKKKYRFKVIDEIEEMDKTVRVDTKWFF